ncbi:PREDICTED: uncharacterized protein LOC108782723 isoform X1 [Cyphomyrmex costatus]|uniref:uncharacterized protein LOC108782723 isoform X1 n=1 Tax=Cyphomyrmex costatus TaxID=456900 RepID=UPI0008523E09|nr:PREDICTED: uncharacterized protein LOC108782723 isoform X1 [Cyphomyrmex costatus]
MIFVNNNDTALVIEWKRKLDEANKKLEIANKKIEMANIIIHKNNKTKRNLLKRLQQLKNCTNNKSQRELTTPLAADLLYMVFNDDQIEYLKATHEKRRLYKWTDETIKKAVRLKHACGDNGYNELLKQHIPLPSPRTLRRRLESITFKDGICDDILELLKEKVLKFPDERDTDCMLCVDEISLTPGEQIDPSTNRTIGYATIPDNVVNV